MDRLNQTLILKDGRKIGYAQYGNHNTSTTTIVYCHGTPSSRLEAGLWYNPEVDVHILSIDRPGYGNSTLHNNRTVMDWPKDLSELLDHLSIKEFRILAVSGGAAYAFATSTFFENTRVESIAICSGLGEKSLGTDGMCFYQKAAFFLTSWTPFIIRPMATMYSNLSQKPNLPELMKKSLVHPSEKAFAEDQDAVNIFSEAFKESFKQGPDGYAMESKLIVSEWDFELSQVNCHVDFYYGDQDEITPVIMGQKMAKLVPKSNIVVYKGGTHNSLLYENKKEIIQKLLS